MGCCSSYEEIYDSKIVVPVGVTCEKAREFLQQETTCEAINSPDEEIINHGDGSWTLRLDGRPPNTSDDSFLVYDTKTTESAAAGDLWTTGALTMSPGWLCCSDTWGRSGKGHSGVAVRAGAAGRARIPVAPMRAPRRYLGPMAPPAMPPAVQQTV